MKRARLLLLVFALIAGAFYLRSLASWRPRQVLGFPKRPGDITHLVFSSDGNTLLVGVGSASSFDAYFQMLSIVALDTRARFAPQWQWSLPRSPHVTGRSLQFSPDQSHIRVDGRVALLDAKTGHLLQDSTGYEYGHHCATQSPDERWLAALDQDDKVRQVFVYAYPTPGAAQHRSPILASIKAWRVPLNTSLSFSFSPSGGLFVLAQADKQGERLDFYDTTTWKRTASWSDWRHIPAPPQRPTDLCVQWSRNGRFVLTWYWPSLDRFHAKLLAVSLWRVSDGQKLSSHLWTPSDQRQWGANSYDVQNDGRVLSWGSDDKVYLSQGPTLTSKPIPLLALPNEFIITAALSPDGSYLVAGTASGRVYSQRVK